MNRRNRKLWISRAQTAALILGLPTLLVFGELLRGYATLGSGDFLSWAAQDLSEFTGAYAYLALGVALTATLVGLAVKRASLRAIRRARRHGLALGRQRVQVELEEVRAGEPGAERDRSGRLQAAMPTHFRERIGRSA